MQGLAQPLAHEKWLSLLQKNGNHIQLFGYIGRGGLFDELGDHMASFDLTYKIGYMTNIISLGGAVKRT